ERIKADPGTILATFIVGWLLVSVIYIVGGVVSNVILSILGAATSSVSRRGLAGPGLNVFGPLSFGITSVVQLVDLVVSSFFVAGLANFSLKVARGTAYAFGDIFGGAPFFVAVLVANFLTGLAFAIGCGFFVVPGVILALGFSLTHPLIVDRNLGPIEAMKASWELTDGHKTNLFIFGLISFLLAIAGLCACGVGVLLVAPAVQIAQMYIYLKLSGQPVAAVGPSA
ncbi:MAG TPA: hypothetical protein VJT73_20365, partial [Polyangiaceae bacterium]|nr:hypothetical protein [Polyangiaceae bacterium]